MGTVVTRLRQRLPADNLGKTRLAAVVLGCLALAINLPQVGNPANPPIWNATAALCILLTLATLIRTHLRGSAPWWELPALPVLITIAGSGLRDTLGAIALAAAVTMVMSLYGTLTLWAVRSVGLVAAIPGSVALNSSSMGREISWHSAAVVSVVPQLLLMSMMMRGLYLALQHQHRASARDAILARTGSKMLGAADVDAVRRLGIEAAHEMIARATGLAMVVLRHGPAGLYLHNLVGLPDDLRGRALPEAVIREPELLAGHVPGFPHWRIESFPDADVHVVVGGVKRVPDEVFDAFRTLCNQVVLGEAAVRSHADLDYQANHDHLTKLPNRAKFFRRLASAVDEQRFGTVALLNIDLDDFKAVNDTYGHGAGDELLVGVAARLANLGVPEAVPARLGGDEFALLLTGLERAEDADRIAERLCARLTAPLRMSSATVTVGASIGVAVSSPGCTAADLTRHADIAMYAAKAQGKNRVERYRPPHVVDAGARVAPQLTPESARVAG